VIARNKRKGVAVFGNGAAPEKGSSALSRLAAC
jgi:hypothetical protein